MYSLNLNFIQEMCRLHWSVLNGLFLSTILIGLWNANTISMILSKSQFFLGKQLQNENSGFLITCDEYVDGSDILFQRKTLFKNRGWAKKSAQTFLSLEAIS
jgi:hypothetical protein